MLRRDLLIGGGLAAIAACAPKLGPAGAPAGPASAPPTPVPTGEAARWAPYASGITIDAASALDLFYTGDPTPPGGTPPSPDEVARSIAADLAAAKASGLTAVVATVAPQGRFWLDDAAYEKTKRDLASWKAKIAQHPTELVLIETAADLETARATHKLGVVFTFQGTEPLGEDSDRVPVYRQMGVRVIQLTHNRRNLVGDGAMEPGNAGLSRYGHEVVERLNAEQVVVDVAHGSQRTIREGILASKRPMLISHTGCRALSDVPRCTPDAELRLLAERGGVAGMILWPYLRTDTQPTASDLIRHIEHAVNVCGEDHVGIGSDTGVAPIERTPAFEKDNREMIADMVKQGIFGPGRPADLYTFLPDLNFANRYETLGAMLVLRGHADARIAKILGGNFARVMREVWG
ncbi:MAG TPA: membrane dipeptidase [Kofleriaceae bacterium]|nr:membrane dipeptidase [Kofleriaceae bacterium]